MVKIKTLLLDDDKLYLNQAKTHLEKNKDIKCLTASSPQKGLDIFEQNEIDVIVSDYEMPEMNGLEFLKIIRREKDDGIPFIVFTGKGREEVAMEALNYGANRYLQKGGDPQSQYGVLAQAIVQEYKKWESERELKESKKRYEEASRFRNSIIEDANVWLDVIDNENNVLVWNKAAEEMSGYSKKEVIGSDKIWQWLYPDDEYREEIIEKVSSIIEGEELQGYETVIRCKDGSKRTINWNQHVTKNENGKIIGSVAIGIDRTKEKSMEEREEFLHSLLRHDVGNKIQVIQGYAQLLKEDVNDKGLLMMIQQVEEAAKNAQDLIEKVRTLKDVIAENEIRPINVCSTLESVILNYKERIQRENIEIHYEKRDIKVHGGALLEEAFSNILENSLNHAECDEIKVTAETLNGEVSVKIEDDGKGVPDDIKDKIFERGYKTGKTGGSGLGLYLVKEIAESYGGSIEVGDSEIGGAMFVIHLKKV